VTENAQTLCYSVCLVRYTDEILALWERRYHCTSILFSPSLNRFKPHVWQKQDFAGSNQHCAVMMVCSVLFQLTETEPETAAGCVVVGEGSV